MDMTVLERQQARFIMMEHQQQISENISNQNYIEPCPEPRFPGPMDYQMLARRDAAGWNVENKPESFLGTCELMRYGSLVMVGGDGAGLVQVQGESTVVDHCLSRSSSCRIGAVDVGKMEEDEVEDVAGSLSLMERIRPGYGGGALHKRKAEPSRILYFEAVEAEEQSQEKRIKGETEVDSSTQEKSSILVSPESSKENPKSSGTQKQDYIHVRARRGQATDSHSLAERARREKISKKMKYLQDLVPGCNKITGRAGMLDEIINYVQSLQRQVEFLSMKLAALNPRQELTNIDNFILKEFPGYANLSTAIANLPLLNLQLNSLTQEQATNSEPELPVNPLHEISTNSPMFASELSLDSSSCFSQVQPFWDSNPQGHHNFGFH